jgi:K+-transporting ATPase ATPase A chain
VDIVSDITQFIVFIITLTLVVKPVGTYVGYVFEERKTFLSPILLPFENMIYKICKVDPSYEMNWKEYAISMIIFNITGFCVLLFILLFQNFLPLNPQQFKGFSPDLALNTATSFVTNTNWQAYTGEQKASYLLQMMGFAVQNFLSAATGIVVLIVLIRGLTRKESPTLGNFWTDIVKAVLYILLPFSFIAGIFLVSQGVIQNFSNYQTISLIESIKNGTQPITQQILPMGPVASQEAIKLLGTNGGGFFGANSAHPFENPTAVTNFFEVFLIVLLPASLTYTFGYLTKNIKHGRAIYFTMLFLFIVFFSIQYVAMTFPNSLISNLGVSGAYIEGQEVRFGTGGVSLFTTATTSVACGAVNAMIDSMLPLAGMVPLLLILLGEVVFGGIGSGLYTMTSFLVIAVFVAGLMIGRTPEFMGKRIEVKEMWMAVIVVLTSGLSVLFFSTVALSTNAGINGIQNPGPHGLTEILYAYASTSNNNGSSYGGLSANTFFYNITTMVAMLMGRFLPAIATIYMAGSLGEKKIVPSTAGTLPTHTLPFLIWLVLVILIIGALTFFPALSLGPVLEHIMLYKGA